MGWTKSDIEKIKNRIISYEGEPVIRRKSNSKGKKDSAAILHIKRILQEYNLIYTAEKKFKHSRNYRLDFAIESEKIGIVKFKCKTIMPQEYEIFIFNKLEDKWVPRKSFVI